MDAADSFPRFHHLRADDADVARQHIAHRHHRQPCRVAPQASQRVPAEPGRRRPHGLLRNNDNRDTVCGVRRVGARGGRL